MSSLPRRLGAVLAPLVATTAVAAGSLSAPADAAGGRDLRPIVSGFGASVEACTVVRTQSVRIFARLDNTAGSATSGGLDVTRGGEDLGQVRFSVRRGQVSPTKSVTFPAGGRVVIDAGIGSGQMGGGTSLPLRRVRPC